MCSCPISAPPCESKPARRWEAQRAVGIAECCDIVAGCRPGCGEAFSCRCFASLPIENSSDDFIRVEGGQSAKERDRIFVSARSHRLESRDRDIQHRNRATAPAQSEVGPGFGALQIKDHFFEQGAQEFLAI